MRSGLRIGNKSSNNVVFCGKKENQILLKKAESKDNYILSIRIAKLDKSINITIF